MLKISRHAQLREQQRAISPLMALLIDECAIEWKCGPDELMQLLNTRCAHFLESDVKLLIRTLKGYIKDLKRIEKKASSKDPNIQVVSLDGMVVTECNSKRVKRKEH